MKIKEVFSIAYGKLKTPLNQIRQGMTPLVSSGGENNGVVGYFDLKPTSSGVISVARTGSIGESFYHPYLCVINSDCMVLEPRKNLSIEEIYWYVLLMKANKERFSYARKVTPSRLGEIEVPNTYPTWVKDVRWNTHFDLPSNQTGADLSLDVDAWSNFLYSEIFEIRKGKRLTKATMTEGRIPYIGATDSRNGITAYIGQKAIHQGNTISVSYNGSVAEAFFQPVPFWATDDVNVLYPKFVLTPKIALFICTLIKQEKYRFNYGRKWHMERMNQSVIRLPTDKYGKPDWSFMEVYIDSLPFSSQIY